MIILYIICPKKTAYNYNFELCVCVQTFLTYIRGRSFVGPWTGKGDKFMTALMDNKTAHCEGRGEETKIKSVSDKSNTHMNQCVAAQLLAHILLLPLCSFFAVDIYIWLQIDDFKLNLAWWDVS